MIRSVLLSLSLSVFISTAPAQVAGLTPLKAVWSTPLENSHGHAMDGNHVVMDADETYLVVDMNSGKKIKVPTNGVSYEEELFLREGKAWLYTNDQEWVYFDVATGKLIPHKAPLPESAEHFVHATADSLVRSTSGGNVIEAHKLDGTLKWKAELPGVPVKYLRTGQYAVADCGTVITLLDTVSGKIVATEPHAENVEMAQLAAGPDLAAVVLRAKPDGFVVKAPELIVVTIDLKQGAVKWTKTIPWPKLWADELQPYFNDKVVCFFHGSRIYLDCDWTADGLKLITLPLQGGEPSAQIVTLPGLRMESLFGAGPALCGVFSKLKGKAGEHGSQSFVAGFDPETLKPVWMTEALVNAGEDDIWSHRDGVLVVGALPLSAANRGAAASLETPGGVCAFKIPAPKPAAKPAGKPAAPARKPG